MAFYKWHAEVERQKIGQNCAKIQDARCRTPGCGALASTEETQYDLRSYPITHVRAGHE